MACVVMDSAYSYCKVQCAAVGDVGKRDVKLSGNRIQYVRIYDAMLETDK